MVEAYCVHCRRRNPHKLFSVSADGRWQNWACELCDSAVTLSTVDGQPLLPVEPISLIATVPPRRS